VAYRPPAAVTMMLSVRKIARRDLLTKSISRETGFTSGVRSRRQVAVPLPRGRGRRRDADPGRSGSEGEAAGALQNRETGGQAVGDELEVREGEAGDQSDGRMSPDLSIGGDLDVDDEGSEQRRFELVQLLHHGSVGYQPVRTRIGLAKNAMSLQANREHKQE
jgi:hypothetical protein